MSGPVTAADVDPARSDDPGQSDVVAPRGAFEVWDSRAAQVGPIPVRRALPQRRKRTVGAWCFFDEGGPFDAAAGGGIGPHPHMGLQTVTWPFAGELLHRDSLGSEQLIRPGELNLMTAGHGIVHAEEHTSAQRVHIAQLWIAQPAATRDGPPDFEHHADLPQLQLDDDGDGDATVLIGAVGEARSPARRDTDHVGLDVTVRTRAVVPAERTYEYAVVPLDGVVEVNGRRVEPGRTAYLGVGHDEISLRTSDPARAIVLGGVPLGERVLMWWNYVARTEEEITVAHQEWTARTERFGLPPSSLAPIDAAPPPWARRPR